MAPPIFMVQSRGCGLWRNPDALQLVMPSIGTASSKKRLVRSGITLAHYRASEIEPSRVCGTSHAACSGSHRGQIIILSVCCWRPVLGYLYMIFYIYICTSFKSNT
ncbi:hypothetical protein FKM82_030013 [Ascaphus truei]